MRLIAKGKNFASFQFGDLTIIALRDGYVDMPPTRLRTTSGKAFASPPPEVPLVEGQLRLSVNAFLIIEENDSVLIDTGASNSWYDTMGTLLDGLQEADIGRGSISYVALTHTHEDHVNGLIAPDGTEAFPQLKQIFVPKQEISVFRGRLAPLRARVTPVEDNMRITARIAAIRAAGHSPGHTVYDVESSVGHLLAWGDIVHVPSIQFASPEIAWEYDDDQWKARAARKAILERVAQPNYYVAGAHLEFPGIGRVVKHNDAFSYSGVE
ncbi:MBL fold metallo-hydrolase [Burkholderia pseudomultivorans]|uniref:MBL fold metallo-hydrolase n=1 Tax=Burkholderia pseudomultivorans TaxID=1207504 RepID=UPI0009BDD458|nr:MBL fold metallo-hydrolase [Burkholderia pseudomultivorans]